MKKVIDVIVGGAPVDLTTVASKLSDAVSTGYKTVTAGQLAVVDPEANLGAASATSKIVQVAQYYSADHKIRFSKPIHVDTVTSIKKQVSVAGVKKVQKITIGTVTAGEQYGVMIRTRSEEDFDQKQRKVFEVKANVGETVATLIGRLVTLINNDSSVDVTAAAADTNTTIAVTAKEFYTNFEISGYAQAETWAVATTTALVLPVNTYNEIAKLEDYAANYGGGYLNRLVLPQAPAFFAEVGATYTTYAVEHKQPQETNEANQVKGLPITTIIAVKEASTNVADFEADFITNTALSLS